MHSRIFEIENYEVERPETGRKILTEDFMEESPERFYDYVDELNPEGVKQSFEWFFDCAEALALAGEKDPEKRCFELTDEVRCRYFEKKFETFKAEAEGLTLEQFSGAEDAGYVLWDIKEQLEERLGFYVAAKHFGRPVSLDYFIRNAPCGKYALIWAMDYHF